MSKRQLGQDETAQRVADALIGVAQTLEQRAKMLRADAKSLRNGQLIPHFAVAYGRNARYAIEQAIDAELPETLAPWPVVEAGSVL